MHTAHLFLVLKDGSVKKKGNLRVTSNRLFSRLIIEQFPCAQRCLFPFNSFHLIVFVPRDQKLSSTWD